MPTSLEQPGKCPCDVQEAVRFAWQQDTALQAKIPSSENLETNRLFEEGQAPKEYALYATILDLGITGERYFSSGPEDKTLLSERQVRIRIFGTMLGVSRAEMKEIEELVRDMMHGLCGDTAEGAIVFSRRSQRSSTNTGGLRVTQQTFSVRTRKQVTQ